MFKWSCSKTIVFHPLARYPCYEVAQRNQLDSDGNILLGGWTYSDMFYGHANTGGFDVFVMQLDSSGSELWTRLHGTGGSEIAYGMKAQWAAFL